MKKQFIVIAAAVFAMLAFGLGTYFYNVQQTDEITRLAGAGNSPFDRPNPPSLGPKEAKVEIMEFFDPACESCRMFYPYVKNIMNANEGKVRLTLRYATFHQGSDYVAKVLEAARMQGQDVYWKSVEALLRAQPIWADHARPQPQTVWNFLGETGLDIERAKRDMDDPRIAELLRHDAADLATLNVRQTPTFFVNRKPLESFGPEGLSAQVQSEISAAYGQ